MKAKRFLSAVLSLLMVASMLAVSFTAASAEESANLALNKTATASSSYPGKEWTPDKAVDGIIDNTSTKNSRWSSKRATGGTAADEGTKEQWLMVDLGAEYTVAQVNVFWEAATATGYTIQGSLDGTEFFDIETGSADAEGMKKHSSFEPVTTKYIRVLCQEPKTARYGYSIYELEVYSEKQLESTDDIIALVENTAPTLSEDGTQVVLPEIPNSDRYSIEIFGTDNQQVVKTDGTVIKPLVDMEVKFTYKITDKTDDSVYSVSSVDTPVLVVPGEYTQEETDNQKPNVVPGLREWKGQEGSYQLTENSRIVYASEAEAEAAEMIKSYFRDMLEMEIPCVMGEPAAGDVYVKTNYDTDYVGEEGYLLTIDDYASIEAPTYTGLIYGGASITQILYQDEELKAPKGIARDYPQYEVRAGMIDVGRMYIPLEYLEEMTIYMSWYKLNEVHVHINDYWGQSGYSAFRLESEVYPEIVAEDGYYTKDEYRQYQKDMKSYSIDVITEIDTPYHAECFRDVPGVVMLGAGQLDITTEENFNANREIIENLIDEYLDGDDPVIQSDKFHMGTDEYDKRYSEQMRAWTDHFIKYINAKGYNTRLWASLGKNGFNGTTPVTNEATVNLWAPYWADVHETYDAGYDVINTYGGWLYIVPAANAGYPDRFNMPRLYNEFEVNNFKSGRNPSGEAIMPVAHPQTKGAEFCIWNDMTSFRTGFSMFDIYDRMKDAVSLVSEKTWFGEDEEGQTYEQFRERIDALHNKAPNTNPGRFVESETDVIADYSFNNGSATLTDKSGNSYDGEIINGTVENQEIKFDGTGYISLPFDSVGYPYTVMMDVNFDEINDQMTLFSGKDGKFFLTLDGKVGYSREAYSCTFDYTLEPNKDYNIALVCDNKNLTLYVNGGKVGSGKLTNETIAGKAQQSSTFVLPTEKIMENVMGTVSSLKIYNRTLSDQEINDAVPFKGRENIALGKDATASSLEVSDGRFTADMAVDGIVSKDSRVSFGKAQDEQWLLVDLGDLYTIEDVVINFESTVGKYEVQISADGESYTTVYTKNEDTVNVATPAIDEIHFEPQEARYVKYVQKERWKHPSNGQWYSGSIYEFEVYKSMSDELLDYIDEINQTLGQYEPGMGDGQLNSDYYESFQKLIEDTTELANSGNLTSDTTEEAITALYRKFLELENNIISVDRTKLSAKLEEVKDIDLTVYTANSAKVAKDALDEATALNISEHPTQAEIDGALAKLNEAFASLKYNKGDVNHDGKLTISDATMIQIYIIKGIDEIDIDTADVDNSGKVDIDDATSVQKVVVGIYKLDGDGNHVAAAILKRGGLNSYE